MSRFFIKISALSAIVFFTLACKKSRTETTTNNGGEDTVVIDKNAPPKTWQEHWFEHEQLLTNTFYDTSICVYYDEDVSKSITWPNDFMAKVWNYTKKVYGNFGKAGNDNRLFVVLHQGKYSGGHPSTYFDASHDNRNTIDCGSTTANAWSTYDYGTVAIPTHEVGHIVEGASKGIHNSPAFPIWGDSKWMEIYIYDVYLGLGLTDFASRWYDEMMMKSDDFPVAGTQWFKNWFYPIYNEHGKTAVLNNFFETLAKNFPIRIAADGSKEYTRDMNMGEFIHFWSGAAGVNLKAQATLAFGWTAGTNAQFIQAQQDFTGIKY